MEQQKRSTLSSANMTDDHPPAKKARGNDGDVATLTDAADSEVLAPLEECKAKWDPILKATWEPKLDECKAKVAKDAIGLDEVNQLLREEFQDGPEDKTLKLLDEDTEAARLAFYACFKEETAKMNLLPVSPEKLDALVESERQFRKAAAELPSDWKEAPLSQIETFLQKERAFFDLSKDFPTLGEVLLALSAMISTQKDFTEKKDRKERFKSLKKEQKTLKEALTKSRAALAEAEAEYKKEASAKWPKLEASS